ncbi:Aspartate-semialdehyde dehydrogenase [Candidatus Bealeia paramacronuclearis]|uniref:Aspartate-semialdehyde dehydrogenase n=1 Tax=Candidatus Bealeia paramacronuclearis TaxID=1921001 RepID=A0ABZ2C1G6_9PROT|nr:Aspartate-semialdehyde dehydrogenase [Candidatus Bealeia paramacronuclearis]
MGFRIAVIGATGNVGREVLSTLAELEFPVEKLHAVASSRSLGSQVSFGEDDVLTVESIESFSFKGIDLAFFCTDSKVSETYIPKALEKGCKVIDKSTAFRMKSDVPLVVPEVNGDILNADIQLVANPNCVVIPVVMALKAFEEPGLKRVVLSTYQSVSGAGREAMDELFNQTRAVYVNDVSKPEHFPKPIAFNVIPQIGNINTHGHTSEEVKIREETQKILSTELPMAVTCVRVPVFIGHSISVAVEFESPLALGEALSLFREMPGLSIVDHRVDGGYVTPTECVGEDNVFISRVRQDKSVENGLLFWLVADNLRKGAALNAVQIAEKWLG